jgi:hypothetical protein
VGWTGGDAWVDYDAWPEGLQVKLSPAQAASISYKGDRSVERVYLYDDGCPPWRSAEHNKAYRRRLAVLAGLAGGLDLGL